MGNFDLTFDLIAKYRNFKEYKNVSKNELEHKLSIKIKTIN